MLFALPLLALVGLNGYAWSENIGWIKFSGPSYQVTINDQTGSYGGYAWSNRVGWIKFAGDGARVCSATAGGDCSNEISENVSGWNGMIKLLGPGYATMIGGNKESGCFLSGYAWGSEVVGWVRMRGPGYGVTLDRCIVPPEPPHEYNLSCSFSAAPRRLIPPQRSARLTWSCTDADQCSIMPGVRAVSQIGGGRTVYPAQTTTYTLRCSNAADQAVAIPKIVEVIRGTLCEVNPSDPSCE